MTPQTSKRNASPSNNKTAAGMALPVKRFRLELGSPRIPHFLSKLNFPWVSQHCSSFHKAEVFWAWRKSGWDQGDQFLPGEEMGISWVTNLAVASTLLILLTRTKVQTLKIPTPKNHFISNKQQNTWFVGASMGCWGPMAWPQRLSPFSRKWWFGHQENLLQAPTWQVRYQPVTDFVLF